MLTFKKTTSLFVLFFLGIATIFAQQPQQMPQQQQQQQIDVDDSEMKQFALAFAEIQSVDQEIQEEMVGAVEEEGLDVQRFNEILNAQQDPNQEVDANEDELKQFASANQEIEKIQSKAQEKMQKVIEDSDLTIQRYQEIMGAVRSNPELQQKLQEHIEE